MTRKLMAGAALAGMLAIAGCNTVNGAGKDLKSAGGAVSDASGENKKK